MRLGLSIIVFTALFALNGCALKDNSDSKKQKSGDNSLHQSSAETILSCLQSNWEISPKSYKASYTVAQKNFDTVPSDYNTLQMVCFNIHPHARYHRFRQGIKQLSTYKTTHPEDSSALNGLEYLLKAINRERVVRRNSLNKVKDEKQDLNEKNQELLEENKQLKVDAEQNNNRLQELKKQIDQLKNIESIIRNREH